MANFFKSLSSAEYSEITDPELQRRVRERYQREISSLQALGFRSLAPCCEALGPFSAVLLFPILLMAALKKEVLLLPSPLRLGLANALLFHLDPPSIALCMGMGVKLYTLFSDQEVLISSDFKSYAVPQPGAAITRLPPAKSLEATWLAHKEQALRMEAQGRTILRAVSFRDYVQMSKIEEDRSQYV